MNHLILSIENALQSQFFLWSERKMASVTLVNSSRQRYKGFLYNPIATQQCSTIATCPGKLRTLNVPLKTLTLEGYHVAVMLFLIFCRVITHKLYKKFDESSRIVIGLSLYIRVGKNEKWEMWQIEIETHLIYKNILKHWFKQMHSIAMNCWFKSSTPKFTMNWY